MKLPTHPQHKIIQVLEIQYKTEYKRDANGFMIGSKAGEFTTVKKEEIASMKVLCEDGSMWIKDCLSEENEWRCIAYFDEDKYQYVFDGNILKQDYRFIDKENHEF